LVQDTESLTLFRLPESQSENMSDGFDWAKGFDLHAVLGVDTYCTLQQLQKAYRRKCLVAHPDKGGTKEQFDLVQAAYEILKAQFDDPTPPPAMGLCATYATDTEFMDNVAAKFDHELNKRRGEYGVMMKRSWPLDCYRA